MRSSIYMIQNNSFCQYPSVFIGIMGFNSSPIVVQYCALLTVYDPGSAQVPKQHQHALLVEGTLEFLVQGSDISTLCSDICLQVHSGKPVFHNPLQESLSMILLQTMSSCFHACPFVLICKLLWHPPGTNFVIPEVLMDNAICRFTADAQLVGHISDSNSAVLLNRALTHLT